MELNLVKKNIALILQKVLQRREGNGMRCGEKIDF